MNKTYSGWHVLYVKSQHEKKVDLLLKESDLDSFFPTFSTLRQWTDRKKRIIKPLFPSYVFLNIRSKNEFHRALSIHGVFKYVRFGKEYAKVRNDEINRIKHFLKLEGISEVKTSSNFPRKGEIMIINYGPLNGLECEVLKLNNKSKVFVRIESLKRNITAVVPPRFLSKKINQSFESSSFS